MSAFYGVYAVRKNGALAFVSRSCTANQKLAEEWINLHLSEPCMVAYARETYYSPTVDNVRIPDVLKPKLVSPADAMHLVDFDWDVVNRNQRAWVTRFNREIAG